MLPAAASVSVVIPALNEARNLPFVLPLIPEWVYEVIIVDGNSTDGTPDVARQLLPDVRVVEQVGPGKGAALRTGLQAARGEIVVMLDADGSTDPKEIPAFVDALLNGADFVKGSRFLPGGGTSDMTWTRKLGNAAFVRLVRVLFGGRYTDLCYGFNAAWRHNMDRMDLDCDGFEIETMMNIRALKAGLKIVEVPSFEHDRIHGTSNLNAVRDGWRVLGTIFSETRGVRARPSPVTATPGAPAAPLSAVPMAREPVPSFSVFEALEHDFLEDLATADTR